MRGLFELWLELTKNEPLKERSPGRSAFTRSWRPSCRRCPCPRAGSVWLPNPSPEPSTTHTRPRSALRPLCGFPCRACVFLGLRQRHLRKSLRIYSYPAGAPAGDDVRGPSRAFQSPDACQATTKHKHHKENAVVVLLL